MRYHLQRRGSANIPEAGGDASYGYHMPWHHAVAAGSRYGGDVGLACIVAQEETASPMGFPAVVRLYGIDGPKAGSISFRIRTWPRLRLPGRGHGSVIIN